MHNTLLFVTIGNLSMVWLFSASFCFKLQSLKYCIQFLQQLFNNNSLFNLWKRVFMENSVKYIYIQTNCRQHWVRNMPLLCLFLLLSAVAKDTQHIPRSRLRCLFINLGNFKQNWSAKLIGWPAVCAPSAMSLIMIIKAHFIWL